MYLLYIQNSHLWNIICDIFSHSTGSPGPQYCSDKLLSGSLYFSSPTMASISTHLSKEMWVVNRTEANYLNIQQSGSWEDIILVIYSHLHMLHHMSHTDSHYDNISLCFSQPTKFISLLRFWGFIRYQIFNVCVSIFKYYQVEQWSVML